MSAGRASKCPFAVLLKHHCTLPAAPNVEDALTAVQMAASLPTEPAVELQRQSSGSQHLAHHDSNRLEFVAGHQPQTLMQHQPQPLIHHQLGHDSHAVSRQTSGPAQPGPVSDQPCPKPYTTAAPDSVQNLVQSAAYTHGHSTQQNANASTAVPHQAPGCDFAMLCDGPQGDQSNELALQLDPELLTQDLVIADSEPEDEQPFLLQSCSQDLHESDHSMEDLVDMLPAAEQKVDEGTNPGPSSLKLDLSPMETKAEHAPQTAACPACIDDALGSEPPPLHSTLPETTSPNPDTAEHHNISPTHLACLTAKLDASSVRLQQDQQDQQQQQDQQDQQDQQQQDQQDQQEEQQQQQQQQQQQGLADILPVPLASLLFTAQTVSDLSPQHKEDHEAPKNAPPALHSTAAAAAGNSALQLLLRSHTPHAAVTSFLWSVVRHIAPQVMQ